MNLKPPDIYVIAAAVIGGVILLNALSSSVSNTVTQTEQSTGDLITTVAPWGLGGLAIWGLLFI